MKCPHCKKNLEKDDYNICPFCEKPIKNICPHCKEDLDQADYNICPFCMKPLKGKAAPKKPARKKVQRLTEEPPAPPAKEQPAPPPVVVQLQEEKKRRLNPLWLLVILLLLLVCCCGLLITEQVEVPKFAAPYIEPYLENMREAFRGFIDPQPPAVEQPKPKKEEEIDCDKFGDLLDEAFLAPSDAVKCDHAGCNLFIPQEIYAELEDKIPYLTEGFDEEGNLDSDFTDNIHKPHCTKIGDSYKCFIDHTGMKDLVSLWFTIKGCESVGYTFPLWEEEKEKQQFQLAEEPVECCEIVEVTGVRYDSIPGVKRILQLSPICDADWPVSPGECIPGETFIGEDHDIFWADVTCCAESDDLAVLDCESDYSVEQKVSWTVVRMEHEECEWESPRFYSPAYYQESEKPEPEPEPTDDSY